MKKRKIIHSKGTNAMSIIDRTIVGDFSLHGERNYMVLSNWYTHTKMLGNVSGSP